MKLTITLTNSNGSPATGLSPVISGNIFDGTQVISGESMTEIANGFYYYDFTGYDYTEDYVFMAYESTLDRYVYLSNDNDSQMNQGVGKQLLGLVQGNMKVVNQTYDGDGNMVTANIYSYENATDANLDQNRLHEYAITASYTSGKLSSYKSVEM